jgi:hypothetical protein
MASLRRTVAASSDSGFDESVLLGICVILTVGPRALHPPACHDHREGRQGR